MDDSSNRRPTSSSGSSALDVSVDRPPSMPMRSLSFDFIIHPLSRSRHHETIRSIQPRRGRRIRPRSIGILFSSSFRPATFTVIILLYVVIISRWRIGNTPTVNTNERIQGLLEIIESAEVVDDISNGQQQQQLLPPWPSYLSLHRLDVHKEVESCIVTAYFHVKSKYEKSKYIEWMEHILSLSDCMVIFCDEDMVPHMLQQRSKAGGPTAVVAMNLRNLPIAKYYHYHPKPTTNNRHNNTSSEMANATAFWQHQLDIDPEKKRHMSYELFWIWLSKSWFVTTAAVLQRHLFPIQTQKEQHRSIEFWMWADIGSFRNREYVGKQLIRFPHKVLQPTDTSTVLWMAHHTPNPPSDPFWNSKLVKAEKHHYYHSGSQAAAATVKAWTQFHRRFVMTLDAYAERNLFVGEDQCVLQTTCLLYPDSCAYVPFNQVPDNHYFGLRYILHHGPPPLSMIQKNNTRLRPFQLWRPPSLSKMMRYE